MWDQIADLHRRGYRGDGVRIGHVDSGVAPWLESERAAYVAPRGFSVEPDSARDATGHGTRTASIITGPGGIAPGARLSSIGVIEGGHLTARLVTGLDWILAGDPQVIVMPIGFCTSSPAVTALLDVARARDILVVCSIGNVGAGAGLFPGRLDTVLSVGACDLEGRALALSGSVMRQDDMPGPVAPRLLAPGRDVTVFGRDGTRDRMTGTSPAAAIIAGIAALMRASAPDARSADIRAALEATALAPVPGQEHRAFAGLVQPSAGVDALKAADWASSPAGRSPAMLAGDAATAELELADRLRGLSPDDELEVVAHLADRNARLPNASWQRWLKVLPICLLRLNCRDLQDWRLGGDIHSIELADSLRIRGLFPRQPRIGHNA